MKIYTEEEIDNISKITKHFITLYESNINYNLKRFGFLL